MGVDHDEELIRDIAKMVIAQVAPEEMPALHDAGNTFFAPATARHAQPSAVLAPVVLAVTAEVIRQLMDELVRTSAAGNVAAAERVARGLFIAGGGGPLDTPVRLCVYQWAGIRRSARNTALRHGLAEETAERIADALVGGGHGGPHGDDHRRRR